MGERQIDTELDSFANDISFGKFDQRCVNLETSAFDAGFGSDIGQVLERFYKFRPAIWVAAVVDCVYADKNIIGRNHFRPGECVCEKDGVACGDVGDRNATRDFFLCPLLWDINVVGKRGAAEDAQVDVCNAMLFCA